LLLSKQLTYLLLIFSLQITMK